MIKTNRTSVCARLVGIGSCEESWACVLLVLVLYGLSAAPVAAQQSDPNSATPQREPESTDVASSPESMFPHFQSTRFWLSGQANFIFQTHPDFHSLYGGPHSLSSRYEKATSRVVTLFTGARVTNSLEFLVNIEESGGSALSDGFGLAGNTNLDIVRNPFLSKAPYLGRAEIHKVFALSGDKVENQRTAFSLFDELPRRRLELRFGKFSMPDFFDLNSVGSDTHFQFTNWTIDNNGAWDYAADTRGYTVGLVADCEDRTWGFRFAEALMPKVANGIDLVWKPWQSHAENFEYELRKGVLPGKPGIVRVLAYSNSANMGVYREQVIQAAGLGAAPDITAHPWRVTRKYGFGLNVEQNISRYLTGFARFGWNDGKTESFAYTEVDQTFNQGIGANGALWHRKQDRAGVAFVSNAIKKDHQNYLAARGLGFLLGDGHLHYGRENILETYYTVHVWRGIYVAPGFQHIVNPGYNRDRGPVTVPSFRAHVEF
jgi:high affinity Mn2+ porin